MEQSKRYIHIKYLIISREFYNSYRIVSEAAKGNIITNFHVKYFLLSRSWELLFKSWLLFKGYTLKQLANTKTFGHNISSIMNGALSESLGDDLNITLDDELKKTISWLDNFYKEKEFEYPTMGSKSVPLHIHFDEPLSGLLKALDDFYRTKVTRRG